MVDGRLRSIDDVDVQCGCAVMHDRRAGRVDGPARMSRMNRTGRTPDRHAFLRRILRHNYTVAVTAPNNAVTFSLWSVVDRRLSFTMKIVGISIVRTGPDLPDPIPLCMACDLSSFGFFQRQVR
jgi:hypothetical protein